MIEVTLGNSYSHISGLNAREFSNLRKLLSYSINPNSTYYTGWFPTKKYLLDKKGNFPTGLLKRVKKWILTLNRPNRLIDKCHRPTLGKLPISFQNQISPYPWQLKALEAAKKVTRGGIVATTGSGKSMAMALIINEFKLKTLIVVPTVEIRNQLREVMGSYFGGLRHITIENIDSTRLKACKDYDLLLIDECHHAAARTYQRLNRAMWGGISRRYFFSATYFRNQTQETMPLEAIVGQPIYELTYRAAVREGYVVPIDAYYINLPKKKFIGETWNQIYNELVVNNKERNFIISELLDRLSEKYTLCLVKEIAHGENLAKESTRHFVSGANFESKLWLKSFNEGKILQLVATQGVAGEGVDTKPAEYIIVAGLGKAKSSFMQAVGRGLRNWPEKDSAKIIIFRDPSHKWLLSHFNAQKKILLDEYGARIVELKL